MKIEEARTPPASWYGDKKFLDLEKQSLFKNHWLYAGLTKDLQKPGDYFTGDIMGRPYIVCLNKENEVQAFANVCLHHGTCVAKDKGNTRMFVCPYHAWNYDLDGVLKRTPGAKVPPSLTEKGLKPIRVKAHGPFVLIHFGDGEGLSSLEDMADHFSFEGYDHVRQVVYQVPCNWKVYVDNYLDGGYHVPHMHKALAGNIDLKSYKTEVFDTYVLQSSDGGQGRTEGGALYGWAHPNFMINRYGNWIDTNWVLPKGTDKCEVVFDYFYRGEISTADVDKALAESRVVQDEDEEVCRLVQLGLESGAYDTGVYVAEFEKGMFHFHQLLADELKTCHD